MGQPWLLFFSTLLSPLRDLSAAARSVSSFVLGVVSRSPKDRLSSAAARY